jgi:hypothetical protein
MDPSHVKQIQLELEKEAKWSVDKLVFEIPGSPPFDIIPYLGESPKAREKLSCAHPRHMTQKQVASCFEIQGAPQGVHLVSAASSSHDNSRSGCFFKIFCERHQMYRKTGKAKKSEITEETNKDAPAPPLYIPGIKIGGPRASKITCGIKGKSMPRKTEMEKPILKEKYCPFQFLFRWKRVTYSWTLNGGTGE